MKLIKEVCCYLKFEPIQILRYHVKIQGQISKTEQDFGIWKSLEFEILSDLTHENQRN